MRGCGLDVKDLMKAGKVERVKKKERRYLGSDEEAVGSAPRHGSGARNRQ